MSDFILDGVIQVAQTPTLCSLDAVILFTQSPTFLLDGVIRQGVFNADASAHTAWGHNEHRSRIAWEAIWRTKR